ncbi:MULTISPECIES: TetR/AcrR family transcriptional regulator [unclassified Pseudomonas]|uniref:TetR/AcrR family transcriptional regulator n=1 Tax=unclassified Pseudomonas TaxID=196821 RepID=UPI000917CFFB|nr:MULTISPECIES: TetR/AcrR family transcriptional regulator [unclassified Pseudomonas]SFX63258.1 transcriptional regulator, TetR family [Pseudomonas sp. NFACC47-1]SFY10982.1 transcriptional regulator, TetR family [Pseudomonas sp. NFACC43]
MPMPERCSRFAEYRDKVLELFACKGFGQVGMRELATCLGLAPGSLYHHYPSKQHLLLDLIEEFYEELLATLQRVERTAPAKRDRLDLVIRAHLNLHQEMPWHFRLAERDSGCLNEAQQERVRQLREQYESKLLLLLGVRLQLDEQGQMAAAHAIAALLNSAPSWLGQYALDEQARGLMMTNMVGGAIERLLSPVSRPGARKQSTRQSGQACEG